jgi:hypothetical protein
MRRRGAEVIRSEVMRMGVKREIEQLEIELFSLRINTNYSVAK